MRDKKDLSPAVLDQIHKAKEELFSSLHRLRVLTGGGDAIPSDPHRAFVLGGQEVLYWDAHEALLNLYSYYDDDEDGGE